MTPSKWAVCIAWYRLYYGSIPFLSCISIKVPAASVTCDYLGCPSRFQPLSCIPTRCLLLKLGQRVTVDIWRGLSAGSPEDYIVLFPTGASSLMWMFCLPHREHEKHTVDFFFADWELQQFKILKPTLVCRSPNCLRVYFWEMQRSLDC